MSNILSNVVEKKALRQVQLNTLKAISKSLACSFGPKGSTTCYRKDKSLAQYTKDGHTILTNLVFNGAIETTMRDDLEDITRRIITTVGDGTTSAIMLSRYIFEALCEAHEKLHISETQLSKDLNEAFKKAIDLIASRGHKATIDDIYNIALVSTNNNEFIADTIKEIYEKNGMDVFIDVGVTNSINTVVKTYDGFTIEEGLSDTAFINNDKHTCEIRGDVHLYMFEDPIDTLDMGTLMATIVAENIFEPLKTNKKPVPTVIFAPKIGRDVVPMMDTLIKFLTQYPSNQRMAAPINVVTNINDLNYLMDLSYLSGGKLIRKASIDKKVNEDMKKRGLIATKENIHEFAGIADMVVSDSTKTKIINPKNMRDENGEFTDLYKNRLADMQNMLEGMEETKESTTKIGIMKRRINSFKANLVEIDVGGISQTDRDNLMDATEDAVLNCRSAAKDGVGYGANYEAFSVFNYLLNESTKDFSKEDIEAISSGDKYNIYQLIASSYTYMLQVLYAGVDNTSGKDNIMALSNLVLSIKKQCPMNIRTGEFDGKILSSIKTDQIILEAIGKIIGLVFETNQFLVPNPAYNTYSFEEPKEDRVSEITDRINELKNNLMDK